MVETEDVVDTVLSKDAAVNLTRESIENVIEKAAEEQAAELKRQQAEALAKMGGGGDDAGPGAGSGQALVRETRASKPLPGVQTHHSTLPGYPSTEPLKPKQKSRQPNVTVDKADAVRDMVDEAIIGSRPFTEEGARPNLGQGFAVRGSDQQGARLGGECEQENRGEQMVAHWSSLFSVERLLWQSARFCALP